MSFKSAFKSKIINDYLVYFDRVLDIWNCHAPFLSTVGRKVHLSHDYPRQPSPNDDSGSESGAQKVHILCSISNHIFSSKGAYRLTVNKGRIVIVSSDPFGLHNAIVTLVQLFRLFCNLESDDDELAGIVSVQISDHPDTGLRASLFDLNPYGRVLKMVYIYLKVVLLFCGIL